MSVVVVFILASSVFAQRFKGEQLSEISLVCGSAPLGKPVTLGVHLVIKPGWHTYWSTPGDAGSAIVAELLDDPGYTMSPVRFPTPHKMQSGDLVTYGYQDEVVFFTTLRPNRPSPNRKLRVKLNWLICREVCLPADTILTIDLDSLPAAKMKEDQVLLDHWTARLPQPGAGFNLDRSGATYSVAADGKLNVFMKFFDVADRTVADFFPDDMEQFVIEYNSIKTTPDGISLILETSSPGATLTKLTGVVLIGTTGYEVSVPVTKQ